MQHKCQNWEQKCVQWLNLHRMNLQWLHAKHFITVQQKMDQLLSHVGCAWHFLDRDLNAIYMGIGESFETSPPGSRDHYYPDFPVFGTLEFRILIEVPRYAK